MLPHIYADFQNADPQGRVRLNCVGTVNDLSRQQVQLREGLAVLLYSDDSDDNGREARLIVEGTVTYSQVEQCWVATIDWQKFRHESETAIGSVPSLLPGGDPSSTSPSVRPAAP
jgi:hypothetical protein